MPSSNIYLLTGMLPTWDTYSQKKNFTCMKIPPINSCINAIHFHAAKGVQGFLYSVLDLYYHGRNILIVFITWRRQNGHLETADEHLRQRTWPHGTTATSTSALKHTRQTHAALAVSASLEATSAFSCRNNTKSSQHHKSVFFIADA